MEPLVSAVMVTGKSLQRKRLAKAAVRAFCEQSWGNRELLIVNDGQFEVIDAATDRVREFRPPRRLEPYTLGELRNYGLEQAQGEWILQWDDDDWYHPDRIKYMMDRRQEGRAVLLLWQIRYSFRYRAAMALRYPRRHEGIPGTVLHPRTDGRYQLIGKHEDSRFLNDNFGDRRVLIDNNPKEFPGPALYLRFYTGLNTWDETHIMGPMSGPGNRNRWKLPDTHANYLRKVLKEVYNIKEG